MKKKHILFTILMSWTLSCQAADLVEVYQQALISDPIFQQAIAQSCVTKENVPISIAALLPNIAATVNPTVTRYGYSGTSYQVGSYPNFNNPRNLTTRTYTLALTVTQPIFNFALYSAVEMQLANAKGAQATLNAALQSLMTRTASAYFAVLKDEENLSYAKMSKENYAAQLDQTNEQFKVGLKTQTDVFTARASYDTAVAKFIAARTTLANDRENLRVITGIYYPKLDKLKNNFPLVTPKPNDVEAWVKTSVAQNWAIKASEYNVNAARANIKQQFAGHLPTVNLQGSISRGYVFNINKYLSIDSRHGPGTTTTKALGFNVDFPIFAGGGVVAQTNQAQYNYQLQDQTMIQTVRDTINTTRQSYMNLIAGVSQIEADRQAITSAESSLKGMKASYEAGTETLVDVLIQQEQLYQVQTRYATDRYAFVNNILALKQAAGTLSFDDLRALNAWLSDK